MTLLLQELSANEIRQLLALAQQHRKRFSAVAHQVLAVAREKDIDDDVARLAITTECLMLAAHMGSSARATFIAAAAAAFDEAERERKAKRQ